MVNVDYPHALRRMADNIEQTLELLTTRLEQSTAALNRVVEEKEEYRKALVRVLELDPMDHVKRHKTCLFRDEVHDAIGGDLIMALMYRPRVILPAAVDETTTTEQFRKVWSTIFEKAQLFITAPQEETLDLYWGTPTPRSMEQHAEALEKLRTAGMPADVQESINRALENEQAARAGAWPVRVEAGDPKFAPLDTTDLTPYLVHVDDAVKEIVDLMPKAVEAQADPCTCTWNADTIHDLEADCPVHGGGNCPKCGSAFYGTRLSVDTLPGGKAVLCMNRWHEAG